MHLKLDQKERFQKTAEATGDLIGIKLQEPQKLHQQIIQKQMEKKYLEENIYPQNQDKNY